MVGTTSNTYDFTLGNAQIVEEAFGRIGIRPPEITREYLVSARRSLNLGLQTFSLRGVNLFAVDLQTIPLFQGVTTYDIPPETMIILDAYIETVAGGSTIDRYIYGMSRDDYAALANKQTQAPPTQFWFDRLISPTITLWPVPDADDTYALKYYRMRRIQDADITMGQNPDVQYRFLDATCSDLTARLAEKYKPEMWEGKLAAAARSWAEAAAEDRERVDIYITPDLSSYYRV